MPEEETTRQWMEAKEAELASKLDVDDPILEAVGQQGPIGPQGPPGEPGATGPQGAEGPQGPIGLTGLQGPSGTGEPGDQGPIGPQGPQGEVGPQGPQGETGLAGSQGPQGEAGPQGQQGQQGPQGIKGDTGNTGQQGIQGIPGTPYSPTYALLANGATAMQLATTNTVKVTPTANATYTTTVPPAGTHCYIIILTSGTVSRTITFGTGFKPSATLATGTTSARNFVIAWISDGTNLIEAGRTAAIVA